MITVYSMNTCPDCVCVKEEIKGDTRFRLVDIGEHVLNLRDFLKLRDTNTAFNEVKLRGSVGIPCFVFPNGKVLFNLQEVLGEIADDDLGEVANADLGEIANADSNLKALNLPEIAINGSACSIDGSGC